MGRAPEPLEPTADQRGCIVEDLPDARVARQPRRARAAHPPVDGSPTPTHPTAMVFDLDPGRAGRRSRLLPRRARAARRRSTQLGLTRVVKTSGGKGLHLSVPLNGAERRPTTTTKSVRARARPAARVARPEARHGRHGEGRSAPGKVFVDWSQNDRHKTTVCAYSLRIARPADRVDAGLVGRGRGRARRAATPTRCTFEAAAVLERVDERRRPLRRLAHRAPGPARASRFARMELDGKSRSSPARAAASAPRPRSLLAERGCKVVCAARATDAAPLPIPGTIDETVRRITDAGGDAIAVPTNLAKDAEVERMVATTDRALRPRRHPRQQRRDHVPRRPRPRR